MGSSRRFSICCAFMGILFAFSASVQLNDQDWYLWLPLYSLASAVNMMAVVNMNRARWSRDIVDITFWLGLTLFVKVVLEACLWETNALKWREFLSLDMERKLVREKLGSGQVIISMWLHSKASLSSQNVRSRIELGMILLFAVNGCLCLLFFLTVDKI